MQTLLPIAENVMTGLPSISRGSVANRAMEVTSSNRISASLAQQLNPFTAPESGFHDPQVIGPSVDLGRFASGVSKKLTISPRVIRPSSWNVYRVGRLMPTYVPSSSCLPLKNVC